MASRFWVGGTGTWDLSTTTNWSASSGGAGGASVPATTDDIFLDGNSGSGVITVGAVLTGCKSLTCTGYTGTLTIGATFSLKVGNSAATQNSSLVLGAGMTFNGGSNLVCELKSGNTGTVTTNGITITNTVQFQGTGGAWTLQDAFTITGDLSLSSGALDTNSKNVSCRSVISSNTNIRTLTLGSSTVTITATSNGAYAWNMLTTTNLTVNAGTSTLLFTGTNGGQMIASQGVSWFNVQRIPSVATGIDEFMVCSDLIVTGTLTITADNATTHRLSLKGGPSSTGPQVGSGGTQRTITAAAVSLTNVDISDIVGAGAATWTGSSLGDGQGNSGITFVTPRTLYGVVAGNWSNSATWSLSSGGAGGQSMPLLHDNVILDANSAAGSYTMDSARPCKNITCTGFTRTLTTGGSTSFYGSMTLASGMTLTITGTVVFVGTAACTLTTAGKSFGGPVQFANRSGSMTLQDNLTTTGASVRLISGTWNLNGFTVTAPTFIAQVPVTTAPTMNMGGGTIVLNGTGTVWNATTAMTTSGGGLVDITDTSSTAKTVVGSNNTYNFKLRHSATGSAGLSIQNSNYFAELDLECTTARTITLTAGTTTTCGTLTLQGASGQTLSLVSSSPGTGVTLKVRRGHLTKTFDSESGDVTITQFNMQTTMLLGVG